MNYLIPSILLEILYRNTNISIKLTSIDCIYLFELRKNILLF
jgi:hypothetical protein